MNRRGMLQALAGLVVGAPIAVKVLPQITREIALRDMVALSPVPTTNQYAAMLVEVFTRDKVFAPFERALSAYHDPFDLTAPERELLHDAERATARRLKHNRGGRHA